MKAPLLATLALLSSACQTYHGEQIENPRPDLLEPQNRVVILGGLRSFDEQDFSPVEEQTAVGIELNFEPVDYPVGFEIGLGFSDDSGSESGISSSASSYEVLAGARKTFRLFDGFFRPYIGLGGSFVYIDASSGSADDDDGAIGIYARGGVLFMFTDEFGLGAEYRKMVGADVSLFGQDASADYDQISLVIALGF
jgi:opacity protein-like surface antigen